MYQTHPSERLRHLFGARPWQGADPLHARFLFIGLDANYSADIEAMPVFNQVLDYHADGVAFWQRHGVHHPFLLAGYRGDGQRFHRTFARIGFTRAEAGSVSFAELMHVPTCGRSTLEHADLSNRHLEWLATAVFDGEAEAVFVSSGVARLMRRSPRFARLAATPRAGAALPTLYADRRRTVYQHLHFSNYGKFQAQLDREVAAIGALRLH